MRKVLCICQGNTCRSPMMERMLRHKLEQLGMEDRVSVESAGLLESAAGQSMAEFSAKELESRGISTDGHVSRFIGSLNMADYDYIVTVGQPEAEQLTNLRRNGEVPVIILAGGVPNPWQQGEQAYRECAALIEGKMEALVRIFQQ
jgi:protein-tyrosine phosphatase